MRGPWSVTFETAAQVEPETGPEAGAVLDVDAERESESWLSITVAGRSRRVRVLRAGSEPLLLVDGRVVRFGLDARGKRRQCLLQGTTHALEVSSKGSHVGAGQGHRHSSGWIEAPMPGKVIQISVTEGALVAAGDSLLVLEAMKMQNDVFCGFAGRVESLSVNTGDAVERGARLLRIVPE